MNPKDFDKYLKWRIEETKKVLQSKSNEYSTEADKLHNFKRAGKVRGESPEEALMGMYLKHLVSVLDIMDDLEARCGEEDNCFPSFEPEQYMKVLKEKIGDSINYHLLLEALIIDRYKNVLGRYPDWLNMEKK